MNLNSLCLTSSWTSCAAAIHQSSRRDPLMMGSVALPELIAATVAQLSQNCGAGEGGEPQSGSYQEVPTLQAGDGETELLKVTGVEHLVKL